MLGTPVGAWYVWLGVGAVSVATLGVALGLPAAAPPDANGVADAIDEVATSPPGSTATRGLDADRLRLGPHRIGLRGPGGSAHASVAFGPMSPATTDERLDRVLGGAAPASVFDGSVAMGHAVADAREDGTTWRRAPDRLRIRHVRWEGIDVVLVG
jgi:hypothetical protein